MTSSGAHSLALAGPRTEPGSRRQEKAKARDESGGFQGKSVFAGLVHPRPVPGPGEGCGLPAGVPAPADVTCGEKAAGPSCVVAHGRPEGGGHFLALDVASTDRGAFAVEIMETEGRVLLRITASDDEGLAWLKGRGGELARVFERSGLHVLGLTLESRGGRGDTGSGDAPGKGKGSSRAGGTAAVLPALAVPSPDETELIG